MKQCPIFLFSTILLFSAASLHSQEKYWVFFKDKGRYQNIFLEKQGKLVEENISDRALERRLKRGIVPSGEYRLKDLPLESNYIHPIEEMGFTVCHASKWFNAVSGTAGPKILNRIRQLPFVDSVSIVKTWRFSQEQYREASLPELKRQTIQDSLIFDYGLSETQILFHNINDLHRKGLNGEGVIVAIFDTGFRLTHPALQNIRSNLAAEYDFVQNDSVTANEPGDASNQDSHGTITSSVLGGFLEGKVIGPAFGARFILAKTEKVDAEIHLEEDNWVAAAEWAESLGADIVSSSLGYSVFDAGQGSYSYQDMDGKSTIITRAANELANRGVLVVNSAGNEGNKPWHYITAPADGYDVLAVGAITSLNQVAFFSSRGPTYDGRIKPDVSAMGVDVAGANGDAGYIRADGTSLSCPLVAGIAAQILQAYPKLNLLQLIHVLRNSGDQAKNPNNERGWGKVDALLALSIAGGNISKLPGAIKAHPPTPNPFNRSGGALFFPVDLPRDMEIRIHIYNILGQKITSLSYRGTNSQNLVPWNGTNNRGNIVPSGIYIYRITAGKEESVGKFVVVH